MKCCKSVCRTLFESKVFVEGVCRTLFESEVRGLCMSNTVESKVRKRVRVEHCLKVKCVDVYVEHCLKVKWVKVYVEHCLKVKCVDV